MTVEVKRVMGVMEPSVSDKLSGPVPLPRLHTLSLLCKEHTLTLTHTHTPTHTHIHTHSPTPPHTPPPPHPHTHTHTHTPPHTHTPVAGWCPLTDINTHTPLY